MVSTARTPIPQVIQSLGGSRPAPALFLDDSRNRIPIMELKELWQLLRLMPVIVLIPKSSAKDQSAARISATKSLMETAATAELLGRLGQAVEQLKTPSAKADFAFGDVTLSFSSMEARRKGEPVTFTAMEFKTLKYFVQNARKVISRDEFLNEVWGYESYPCTRTVDNHILKLRQKLEKDPSRPVHFRTVHGAGYKFLP